MKTKLASLLLTSMLFLKVCSTAHAQPVPAQLSGGGGGDATEIRVNEIRSDILKWINDGGHKELTFPLEITTEEYRTKMSDILRPKAVVIGFVENDNSEDEELRVIVDGKPKTCRGFYSRKTAKPNILCHIGRFKATTDSEQYKLIHHEYAGLALIEKNDGAASDYQISSQITDFLVPTTVLKLALKKMTKEELNRLESKIILSNKKTGESISSFCLPSKSNCTQIVFTKNFAGFKEEIKRVNVAEIQNRIKAGTDSVTYDHKSEYFAMSTAIVPDISGMDDVVEQKIGSCIVSAMFVVTIPLSAYCAAVAVVDTVVVTPATLVINLIKRGKTNRAANSLNELLKNYGNGIEKEIIVKNKQFNLALEIIKAM